MQFVYILKPIPHLQVEENWTDKDNEIVGKHFSHLQDLLSKGQLILAGKTNGLDEKTIGLVLLEVDSEDAALAIMKNDPAVKEGIMTAEIFPYTVALFNNEFGK